MNKIKTWQERLQEICFEQPHPDLMLHPIFEAMEAEISDRRASLATQHAAVVPTGWRLVPVEPTLTMLDKGGLAIKDSGGEGNDLELQGDAHSAYSAMLAAAPQAPDAGKDVAPTDEQIQALAHRYAMDDQNLTIYGDSEVVGFARELLDTYGATPATQEQNFVITETDDKFSELLAIVMDEAEKASNKNLQPHQMQDYIAARKALIDYVNVRLTTDAQSVRDAALEEAAKALRANYVGMGMKPDDPHPDAVLINEAVHECISTVLALKTTAAQKE